MAIRVYFEIGHEASIRRPNETFTHDWEIFVRGLDNADISQFVDKVVFYLHETFPKPKRVVKDPPYAVKESGYAGFNLPIEIHLKNKEEPKKISFDYNLHLQPAGPPIKQVQREKYIFTNPSDEFRRKLLKGGASFTHAETEPDRNGRDALAPSDRPASQLVGKPKLSGDTVKKHKFKDHDPQRPSSNFENLFGTPIHKTSRISPDPKKPSPKADKKAHSDRDKQQKVKYEPKEKEHKEERKSSKDEKVKDEKKQKTHKEKDKSSKRPSERSSPGPPPKRPPPPHAPPSPRRVSSPNNRSNSSVSSKEDVKAMKQPEPSKPLKSLDPKPTERKTKGDRVATQDRERDGKKNHKKDARLGYQEVKEVKPFTKDMFVKESKDRPPVKPLNKFSIENMVKDPQEMTNGKHRERDEKEKKHKHKKKDKKREEPREKLKDPPPSKDKKYKNDKAKEKSFETKESHVAVEKEPLPLPKDGDKTNSVIKNFKEKDRNQYTKSPISLDTSSQSSSRSANNLSKSTKTSLGSSLSSTSASDSDSSAQSDSEETSFNSESSKSNKNSKMVNEVSKPAAVAETSKNEKSRPDRNNFAVKPSKGAKEKPLREPKEEKKQKKRKSKPDESDGPGKFLKNNDEPDHKVKRIDVGNPSENGLKGRVKSDTKVQDDGVSSSLSDNPVKCASPAVEEDSPAGEPVLISTDYIMQLRQLQKKIMTIQSNDELERVVNLVAETGKYEVTKKTFDFDLCTLDRNTVQQLLELIGCESRA